MPPVNENISPLDTSTSKLRYARRVIFSLTLMLSLTSCAYFFHAGSTNIYGDGIAHLNIARRVVDIDERGFWPHYAQLGSPWLPLPHLLMLFFIWQDFLWRSGLAGSIVSMICYVAAVLLIFEIGSSFGGALLLDNANAKSWRAGAIAAAIFAFNPSLLYMQTTPMTELPFLASVALTVWLLMQWSLTDRSRLLILSGFAAALATLTRYEAWALLPAGALIVFLLAPSGQRLRATLIWSSLAATGPLYWLWHNWATYGNALEFYNGYYSAKKLYLRLQDRLSWTNFVVGNIALSTMIGVAAAAACSGLALCLLGLAGIIRTLLSYIKEWPRLRATLPVLLLALPFLFTVYSLYTGNIQIYPFSAISLLNVRYGLNLALALPIFSLVWLRGKQAKLRMLILILFVLANYGWLLSGGFEQLAVFQEPCRNNCNTREAHALTMLAAYLRKHPPAGKIMMYGGELMPVIASGGLNFRDIIFQNANQNSSDDLPTNAQSVIVKEGDELWQRLQSNANFQQHFELIYRVEPAPCLMVWHRRH